MSAPVPGGEDTAGGAAGGGSSVGGGSVGGGSSVGDGDPLVRVVQGVPDDVELAALIAGLTAAALPVLRREEAEVGEREVPSEWETRSRAVRGAVGTFPRRRGADAWRWSLHP